MTRAKVFRRGRWPLVVASVLLLASRAAGYSILQPPTLWPAGNITMQLELGVLNQKLTDGSTSWDQVAQAAFSDWNQVLQRSHFLGVSGSTAQEVSGNRLNNVFFSGTVYGEAWGSRVVAVTLSSRIGATRIESDVLFNNTLAFDSYRGALHSNVNDLKRVALHEFGHVLGLDHPDDNGQVVAAVMNSVESNYDSLQADDIAGVKSLYDLPSPPAITLQPLGQIAGVGATVTFTVSASGTAPLLYQWRLGGANLPGATGSSLSINSAQFSNAGTYSVLVSNSLGSVLSAVAALTVVNPARISNVSVRTNLAASQILTMGVVTNGAKNLLVRAVGPGLNSAFQLAGVYPDPKFVLYNQQGGAVDQNDDWDPSLAATFASLGAFPLVVGSKDAGLLRAISGPNTVQCSGTGSGIVLVELYDADAGGGGSRVTNISARNRVGTGADILICGFVLDGAAGRKVMLRGIGPGLHDIFGLTGVLADPFLELHQTINGKDTVVASNDDWSTLQTSTFDAVGAYHLVDGSKDSVMILTLAPGVYTVQLSGTNGGTGDGVIEVYEVP